MRQKSNLSSVSSVLPSQADVVVVGSGTGLLAALAAHQFGLSVVVVEKASAVGGSTARSGGAFWIPANPILVTKGAGDSLERAERYLQAAVGESVPELRWRSCLQYGPEAVDFLQSHTKLKFSWAKGYPDYHPELPGGSAVGRSCEARPFDAGCLGPELERLEPAVMEAPFPMPVTGADYKWLNLTAKRPQRGIPIALKRMFQGIGGKVIRRRYVAGGQALAAGLFEAVLSRQIPVLTETPLNELEQDSAGRISAVVVKHQDREHRITATKGVILAAGGFDHDLPMRRETQLSTLGGWSLGVKANEGDGIVAATAVGAATSSLEQAWWFPATAPLPGQDPTVMLAERSLPGSFMIDRHAQRFVNESCDYMSFGQVVLQRHRNEDPVGDMWLIFDSRYRNSYLFGGTNLPGMPLPREWYQNQIAYRAGSWADLAALIGVSATGLEVTAERFNELAIAGVDEDFGRGASAYDRYYGDPTVAPNPNLRAVSSESCYAVKVVLSDLGTCGGVQTDDKARVLNTTGEPLAGLYAIGNNATNVFGDVYPGAGATIGQGLVFGYLAAKHIASS